MTRWTHVLISALVVGGLLPGIATAQEKATPLSGKDANADYLTLRAEFEAMNSLKSPEERKAANEKFNVRMAEFVKLYDGKIDGGPAQVALALAHQSTGNSAKGQEMLQAFKKGLIGKPAPSLEVWKGLGATDSWSLADAKGKVVLIDFWATWCGPCRGIIPNLVETYEKHKGQGLVVVGATQIYGRGYVKGASKKDLDEAAEVKLNEDFKAEFKMSYPVVLCQKNTAMFNWGVTGIPTVFLVDKKGVVRDFVVGGGDHSAFEKKIEELLAENAQ